MSIPVSPAELPEVLARFGSASLISHAAPHVKVHTVDPVVEGEDLVVEPVRESLRASLAADPHVTLVWQPLVRHGWTLIVDGVGRIDGDRLRIAVESGILHRPRAHSDGPAWAHHHSD